MTSGKPTEVTFTGMDISSGPGWSSAACTAESVVAAMRALEPLADEIRGADAKLDEFLEKRGLRRCSSVGAPPWAQFCVTETRPGALAVFCDELERAGAVVKR